MNVTANNRSDPDPVCDICLEISGSGKQSTVNKGGSKVGLVLAGLTGGAAIALSVVCFPFVAPALRRICLPYVPASSQQVENVVKGLSYKTNKGRLIDLGSGDGRIVFAAAKSGYASHGVELNGVLVWYSRLNAWRQGLREATFTKQDLFKVDIGKYSNIVIFGVDEMMPELEVWFSKSLTPSSKIIACRFPLPNWTPERVIGEGIDTVWIYEKK